MFFFFFYGQIQGLLAFLKGALVSLQAWLGCASAARPQKYHEPINLLTPPALGRSILIPGPLS